MLPRRVCEKVNQGYSHDPGTLSPAPFIHIFIGSPLTNLGVWHAYLEKGKHSSNTKTQTKSTERP